jgi:TP901 family phage tail tape measure protein
MTDFNLKLIFQAIDKVSAPAGRMAKAIGSLARNTGLDQVAKTAGTAGKALGTTAKEAAKVAGAFSLAAGGVFAFVKSNANTADLIAKTADKLGVGIESLQRLEHHAELSGVANTALHDSLRFLQNGAGEAARGMGAAKDTFAALGIAVTDGNGKLKDAESLMFEIADAMTRSEDPAARVAVAQDLFGRSGVDMINALKGGSQAMKESGKEAEELGLISEKQARQAEAFNDAVTKLSRVLENIGFILANQLMPPLTEFVGWLKELAVEAKPEVARRFKAALESIKSVLPELSSGFGAVISVIGVIIGWLATGIEATVGWERAIQILASILGLNLLKSLWASGKATFAFARALVVAAAKMLILGGRAALSMIGGLTKVKSALALAATGVRMLGSAILATPIGWLIGGLALAAGAAWLLWENWEQIAAYLGGLWDEVTAAFDQGVIQGFAKLIENFNPVSLMSAAINGLVRYLFGIDLAAIGREWIGGFGEGVSETLADLMNWMVETLKETLSFLPDSWLEKIGMADLSAGGSATAASFRTGNIASALPGQSGFSGELRISIDGAPPGTRVETVRKKGDDIDLRTDVGYSMAGG